MTKINLPKPSAKTVRLVVNVAAMAVGLVVVNVLLDKAADKIGL